MSTGLQLEAWIARRRPPTPQAFAPWMRPADGAVEATSAALAGEAHAALTRALDSAVRPRRGAFDLLAADGFATWACEAALESTDADGELRAILQTLLN